MIPNMENTPTKCHCCDSELPRGELKCPECLFPVPSDLPAWLTQPQAPKEQADGVVMVRYPRVNPLSPQRPPQISAMPVPESGSTSKKRKLACPNLQDALNGLMFFNREGDDLYTITGTKDAIKVFAICWD